MAKKVNVWAFALSIVCIFLLIFEKFWKPVSSVLEIHPLHLIFYFTLIIFFLGQIGFAGAKDWKGFARSIMTIILTLGLLSFLTIVIFIGSLLS